MKNNTFVFSCRYDLNCIYKYRPTDKNANKAPTANVAEAAMLITTSVARDLFCLLFVIWYLYRLIARKRNILT